MKRNILFATLLVLAAPQSLAVEAPKSFLPEDDALPRFIDENFDITTIRSLLGPRRSKGQRHTLADMGLKLSKWDGKVATFEDDDTEITATILNRRDENGDGIMDVAVCWHEYYKTDGNYNTQSAYLITRYSATSPAVAIAYTPAEEALCPATPNTDR